MSEKTKGKCLNLLEYLNRIQNQNKKIPERHTFPKVREQEQEEENIIDNRNHTKDYVTLLAELKKLNEKRNLKLLIKLRANPNYRLRLCCVKCAHERRHDDQDQNIQT